MTKEGNHETASFRPDRGAESIVRAGVLLCALLVVSYCVWTLDRGFDITDEAYYLLLGIYPESVKMYISAQQWITGGIWRVTGSLSAFRAAGLILLVASTGLLALGAIVALSYSKLKLSDDAGGRALVLGSSIVCALLYVETINFSPSYNLLAASGAYAATGLVLLALHAGDKWCRLGLLLLAGGALGVEFVSKPSAGVATLCLLAMWVFFLDQLVSDKFIAVATVIFGLLLCVLTLVLTQTTILDARSGIASGFELFRMVQDEPVGARLIRYIGDFFGHVVHALKHHVFLIVTVGLYLLTRHRILLVAVFAVLVYSLVSAKYHLGYSGQYELQYAPQMEFAFVLFILMLLVSIPVWKNSRPFILLTAGLIVLPYTVGVGTGNSIYTQIISCLAPWGVAIAAMANLNFERRSDKLLAITLLGGFVVAFSLQIIAGVFRAPYHMVQPLVKQIYPVNVGVLGSLKVDAETRDFLGAIESAAKICEIVPGTPFFGLYNVPGVALVLQTVPVLTPWLNNLAQAEAVLKSGAAESVRSSVVALLLDADGSSPPVPDVLGFPADFRYCGTATFPLLIQEVQIWKHE